ncbi:MAG: hypothetical protein OXU61_12425 [Gammaproteobacteria bacterium]|nr:hypothetical protein [Gammaproteobacteria bacterium]
MPSRGGGLPLFRTGAGPVRIGGAVEAFFALPEWRGLFPPRFPRNDLCRGIDDEETTLLAYVRTWRELPQQLQLR